MELLLKELFKKIFHVLDHRPHEAMDYYFKLMGQILNVDEANIKMILEQVEKNYIEEKWHLDTHHWVWSIVEKHPIVEGLAKLIRNHVIKRKLKEDIFTQYVNLESYTIPKIVEHYKHQINNL